MDEERRHRERLAWRGVPERLGLAFSQGNIDMRAKPNGTAAGSNFEWNGYAAVYGVEFDMWDRNGDPYSEHVEYGASKRSLNNPNLDVPFLIGHNHESGIPLARTKSGTMRLSEDSHGTHSNVPAMDGRREDVRALASAVERGDMSEMSLAFVTTRQEWDASFEHRAILEWDLHRGDVCAVVHGANSATDGATMFPVEQLSYRRPPALGAPRLLEARAAVSSCGELGHECCGGGECNAQEHRCCDAAAQARNASQVLEFLSVTAAERDKAKAAGNSLPDGSYSINNVKQLHAAAILAASHHGDWKAAQSLIRRRAKELGVDVTTLPGFGEGKASGRPLELLASAAEDFDLSTAPDYNAAPAALEHGHPGRPCLDPDGDGDCDLTPAGDTDHDYWSADGKQLKPLPSQGSSARVTVDPATGIPGEEVQMSAGRPLELMMAELDLEELASHR